MALFELCSNCLYLNKPGAAYPCRECSSQSRWVPAKGVTATPNEKLYEVKVTLLNTDPVTGLKTTMIKNVVSYGFENDGTFFYTEDIHGNRFMCCRDQIHYITMFVSKEATDGEEGED